jgi:hypothetical protein
MTAPIHLRVPAVALDDRALQRVRAICVLGLIVLNAADLLATRHLLTIATGARETNPLMAPLVLSGVGACIKIGVPCILAVRHLRAPVNRVTTQWLVVIFLVYVGVVTWNLHLIQTVYG